MIRLTFALAVLAAATGAEDSTQRVFAAAAAQMKAGKLDEAAKGFQEVLNQEPDFAEALFALGVCSVQLGKPGDAIPLLGRYVALEPKAADGHAVLGIVLLGEGRFAAARSELEQAIRLDPSQAEAIKALARLHNIEGNPARALSVLRALSGSPSADDEARRIEASALLRSGDAAEAAALLERMLESDPRSPPETYILAATARRKGGDARAAMEICERGLRFYPNSERLESLYAALPPGVLGERTAQRLAALEKNSGALEELLAVGRVLTAVEMARSAGGLEAAQQLFLRAVKLAPENAAAWYHTGRCLRLQNKPEAAVLAFERALSLHADDELRTLIYTRLAVTVARQEHFERADDAFRRALQLNRKLKAPLPEAAFEYYRFMSMRARDDEGRALLDEILRWEPLFAPARLERAKLLAGQDQPREAIQDALLVVGNAEDLQLLRSAHYLLAKCYNTLGRKEEARIHQKWIESH